MSLQESRRPPQRESERRLQRHARGVVVYASAVAGLALALIGGVWSRAPLTLESLLPIGVLLLIGAWSMYLGERDTGGEVSVSFAGVVYMTAAALVGPAGAGLVGGALYLIERRSRPIVRMFNAAMTATMATLGGIGYLLAGGQLPVSDSADPSTYLRYVGLPLLVTNLVVSTVNIVLLSVMVRITGGDARQFITGAVRETAPLYLGYTLICFLFVILWVPADVGPLSGVLILAPLLVARWIYAQYGDEVRAHNRILDTLVVASDWGNSAAMGHGRRVGAVAAAIAAQLGLSAREGRSLRYAAALHDIGRLGLRTATLRRHPSEADEDDVAEIHRHPEVAQHIVGDIAFLAEASLAIRHHHERFDGLGYPDGLAGQGIPLLARIVSVADAFDALTTPLGRPALTPQDALDSLRRRSGTLFDPRIVEALAGADADELWRPSQDDLPPHSTEELWWDHDDPSKAEQLNSGSRRLAGGTG